MRQLAILEDSERLREGCRRRCHPAWSWRSAVQTLWQQALGGSKQKCETSPLIQDLWNRWANVQHHTNV